MNNGLVLGFFDGVHIAHEAVIKSALDYADNVILITFKEAPAKYFNKDFEYIYSREKSINKIKALGVNEIVELDFSKIVNINAKDYLEVLLSKYSPISISTGFNHTFGFNKLGNANLLEDYSKTHNFKYFCVPAQIYNSEIVSSTLIRNMLREGNVKEANKLLNSKFSIEGTVVHGAQLGRKLGFPTANIEYPKNIIKLPYGVYSAEYNNKKCVLNWGIKPTISKELKPIAEIHILDFNENIYDKNIEINITNRIRNEQKFNNLEELKTQIKKDVEACLKL